MQGETKSSNAHRGALGDSGRGPPSTHVVHGGDVEMSAQISKSCRAVTRGGSKCQVVVLPDSEFCFFHDPSQAAARREAQAEGGRQNRLKTLEATAQDVEIVDSADVIELLIKTINHVRKGQIDPKVANSVGFLANILMKVLEHNHLESRIERLEALLKEQTSTAD